MSKMRISVFASHLNPYHSIASIFYLHDIGRLKRPSEAGPSCAGMELVCGTEEGLAGDNINVDTF